MQVFTNRGYVDVCDAKCCARPCLQIMENRGTFVQGCGYTKLSATPNLVCGTRHLNGCPHPLPDLDPEAVRCCLVPDFPPPNKSGKQRCRTCGLWAQGWDLDLRRNLPALPHVDCKHKNYRTSKDGLFGYLWHCPDCKAYWNQEDPPDPCQIGSTYAELLDGKFKVVPK